MVSLIIEKISKIDFLAGIPCNSRKMKPKINTDHVCALAHLKLTEEEKSLLEPQMIKIVEWVDKLEELELDVSKSEVYSPVSFCLPFLEDETRQSLTTESAFLMGEKEDPIAMYLSDIFTMTANFPGVLAISIYVGLSQQRLPWEFRL